MTTRRKCKNANKKREEPVPAAPVPLAANKIVNTNPILALAQGIDVIQLIEELRERAKKMVNAEMEYDNPRDNVFKHSNLLKALVDKLTTLKDVVNFYKATSTHIDWDRIRIPLLQECAMELYEENGHWEYHMIRGNGNMESYSQNFLTPFLLNQVHSLTMESTPSEKQFVNANDEYVNVFEKARLTAKDITIILLCNNLINVDIKSFAIDDGIAEIFEASAHLPFWKVIRHLTLDDVYHQMTEHHKRSSDVSYLLKRALPDKMVNCLMGSINLETFDLRSMCISEKMTKIMAANLIEKKGMKQLCNIILVNLITMERNRNSLDDVFVKLCKLNASNGLNVTVSIQRHTYGTTFLRRLVSSRVKLNRLHLVINENGLNREVISLITKYQALCEEMTLTFHEVQVKFTTDQEAFAKMVIEEFPKWDKVDEVIMGTDCYWYRIDRIPGNRLSNVFNNLPRLKNLKVLRIEDRICTNVFDRLARVILPRLKLLDFSIKYFNERYEKRRTIDPSYLLLSLPSTLKELTIFPYAVDLYTFGAIVAACPNLESLAMHIPKHIAEKLPNPLRYFRCHYKNFNLDVRTDPIDLSSRLVPINYWLDNVERKESHVF